MSSRLFVGNLSFNTSEQTLRDAFASDGRQVKSVAIMTWPDGAPRGYAFVEMGSEADAEKALTALNGKLVDGRPLRIDRARERDGAPRSPRGPGGPNGPSGPPRYGDRPSGPSGDRGPPRNDRPSYQGDRGAPSGPSGYGRPAPTGDRPGFRSSGPPGAGPRGPRPGGFGRGPVETPPTDADPPGKNRATRRRERDEHERSRADDDDDWN